MAAVVGGNRGSSTHGENNEVSLRGIPCFLASPRFESTRALHYLLGGGGGVSAPAWPGRRRRVQHLEIISPPGLLGLKEEARRNVVEILEKPERRSSDSSFTEALRFYAQQSDAKDCGSSGLRARVSTKRRSLLTWERYANTARFESYVAGNGLVV